MGFPGNVNDTCVLRQSNLWERFSNEKILSQDKVNIAGHEIKNFLIGEPTYTLQTWLAKG